MYVELRWVVRGGIENWENMVHMERATAGGRETFLHLEAGTFCE